MPPKTFNEIEPLDIIVDRELNLKRVVRKEFVDHNNGWNTCRLFTVPYHTAHDKWTEADVNFMMTWGEETIEVIGNERDSLLVQGPVRDGVYLDVVTDSMQRESESALWDIIDACPD